MSDPLQPHPAATYYPVPVGTPEPPKNLTTLAVLAFAGASLTTIFTVINASLIGRAVRTGGDRGDGFAGADWSVAAYYFSSFATFVALVGAWVAGSMWLYQARKNVEAFDPSYHHTRSAGWAWGGWLVPIVSLWFPFQLVRDVHNVSTRYRATPLIGWWWGLYLVMVIAWRVASNVEGDALALGTNASGAQSVSVFTALTTVAALVLWGLVIRKITLAQHARMYAGPS